MTEKKDDKTAGDVPRRTEIPATKAVLADDQAQAAGEKWATPGAKPAETPPAPKVVLADDVSAAPKPFADDARDKGTREAEVLGVDYQRAGQVRQLLGERANLVAYGNTDRVEAIDEALRAAGYTGDIAAGADGDPGPLGRATRADKQVHAAHPGGGPDTTAKPAGVGPKTAPEAGKGVTSSFMSPPPPSKAADKPTGSGSTGSTK